MTLKRLPYIEKVINGCNPPSILLRVEKSILRKLESRHKYKH